ncbi:MAG: hypothetical protein K0U38_06760 [Epsilonproteobacteria bacterium]|nr:hypothetical protein [Campylobacterota bacterium]
MKLIIITTLLLSSSLVANPSTDMERNMYEPAREMMQMDDAMNRAIEQHNQKEQVVTVIDETGAGFVNEPMSEFQDKGDRYILEKAIPKSEQITVKVGIKEEMIEILIAENKIFKTDNYEQNMSSTTSEMHTIPIDADAKSMTNVYSGGMLTITLLKRGKE